MHTSMASLGVWVFWQSRGREKSTEKFLSHCGQKR
jgi:hypothetical protein